jgi:hypothetical protein
VDPEELAAAQAAIDQHRTMLRYWVQEYASRELPLNARIRTNEPCYFVPVIGILARTVDFEERDIHIANLHL